MRLDMLRTPPDSNNRSGTWLTMAPAVLLSLLGAGALIALLIAGARLDRQAERESSRQVAVSVDRLNDALATFAKDGAFWDEAFEKLFVNFDPAWAHDTFGTGSIDSKDGAVDDVLVVTTDGVFIDGYGSVPGLNQAFVDGAKFGPMIQKADAGNVTVPAVIAGMVETAKGMALAAAVAVTPQSDWPEGLDPHKRPVVIALNFLNGTDFQRIEAVTGVADLAVAADAIPGHHKAKLAGPDGRPVAWLIWAPPTPGRDMVRMLALPVILFTIVLFALSFVAGRRILAQHIALRTYAARLATAGGLLETAIGAIDDGLCIVSDGTVEFWNRDFERLLGQSPRKQVTTGAELHHAVLGGTAKLLDGDEAGLRDGTGDGQWLLLGVGGQILSLRRFSFGGGNLLVVRDVTAAREEQQGLLEARRAAEAANQDKSKFLAQMSHELRTPLNAILGFAEVISLGVFGEVQPPAYKGYAENIRRAGDHLLAIINDILDLSKIEAGRMEVAIDRIDVASLAKDAGMLVRDRAQAKGVKLEIAGADDVLVHGDPKMVKQILINLLSNAVKFTSFGGHIRVGWRLANDGMVEIVVADSGIGMSKDDLKLALQPFGQARRHKAADDTGTGLGLPIVVSLCKLQGGSFAISSEPGIGTAATVRLPVEAARNAA